jgi:hypothetical protein
VLGLEHGSSGGPAASGRISRSNPFYMPLFNYNIEPALESALVSLLADAGVPAHRSLGTDDLARPYTAVSFELGAERAVDAPSPPGGVSTTYDGQYTVTVVTDRDQGNGAHSELRATVREVLAESSGEDWAAALGARFRILSIRHQSTVYDVLEDDKGIDASAMSYAVTVRLLQG